MDLVRILKRPEGKTLEFKRNVPSPHRALKTLVAFANSAGGILVVAGEERTRRVRVSKARNGVFLADKGPI
jgi:predicted HTH transcriptional regulator